MNVAARLGKLHTTPRVVPGEKSVSRIGVSGRTMAEEIPAPEGVERALVGWRLKKPDGWWLSGRVELETEIGPAQLELGNTTLCQCCVVKGTPYHRFHEIPPATDCYVIGAPAWEAVPTDEYRDNEWIAVFGTKDQEAQVYFHSRQMVAARAWSSLASVLLWLVVIGEAAWARLVGG
jgi:hypothetical protein